MSIAFSNRASLLMGFLAIVGTGIALAALFLGAEISEAMNSAGNCIDNPSSTTCA